MYTAAVLLHDEADKLRQIAEDILSLKSLGYDYVTKNGQYLPHHMTVNLGEFDENLNLIETMGKVVDLFVGGFAYDHEMGICAAKVEKAFCHFTHSEVVSANKQRHITMAIKKNAKPYLSNMLDWKSPIEKTKGFIELEPHLLVLAIMKQCD